MPLLIAEAQIPESRKVPKKYLAFRNCVERSVVRSRTLVLVVLVFACLLAAGSASAETCRYICSGTILQGSATHCCGTPFQCPDGKTVYPYGYNNGSGWRICGSASAASPTASGFCGAGAGAASLPDWAASEAVPAP